jgi:hypothetical protein
LQEIELSLSIHLLHDHLTSEEQAVLERKEIILTRLKVLDRNDFIARPQYLLHTLVKTIKFNFAKFSEMHPAYLSLDVRSCFYNLDEKIEFLTQVLKQNNPSPDDYRIACYGLYGLIASFKEYDSIKAREEYSYNFNEMIDNLIQLNSWLNMLKN